MLKFGGVVIPMQQTMIDLSGLDISYEVGDSSILAGMQNIVALEPFSDVVMDFFGALSKELLQNEFAKEYSDIVTLAFWLREASLNSLKRRFCLETKNIFRLGRGIAFHISPSNVPVNYAYSLATGLLCGNSNVVRCPSKAFPQVSIINKTINKLLLEYKGLIPYIVLLKYGHDKNINDALSNIADIRIIWGGDNTIQELRKSPLKPRATEIAFANRFSLVVVDSDAYIRLEDKNKIAQYFYNDTFFNDQNACTAPQFVIWYGKNVVEAKNIFWDILHKHVRAKYNISGVQAVNKLTQAYLLGADKPDIIIETNDDNLIYRIQVSTLSSNLLGYKENSGYFFEYDCGDILELKELCNDTRCQTVSYIGNKSILYPLLCSGIRGVDRIVPVGKTMDFDFIWDGYNLFERMTRSILHL